MMPSTIYVNAVKDRYTLIEQASYSTQVKMTLIWTTVCNCACYLQSWSFAWIIVVGHILHSRLYLNELLSQATSQNKVTSSTLGIKLLDKLLRQTMVPDQTSNNIKLWGWYVQLSNCCIFILWMSVCMFSIQPTIVISNPFINNPFKQLLLIHVLSSQQ